MTETPDATPTDPVDWSTARRVARRVAGRDPLADSYLAASLQSDFATLTVKAEALVAEHTGLRAPGRATAEVLDRHDWVDSNIASMRRMLEPLLSKFGEKMAHNPFAPVSTRVAATEVGALLGYMSQRVLGQYELTLIAGTANPRLLFVGTNLNGAAAALQVDREAFVRWVTVHELTHAMQFGGVPWLRDHMGAMLKEYLELVDVKLDGSAADGEESSSVEGAGNGGAANGGGRTGGLLGKLRDGAAELPDPQELAARFREGGVAALIQTDEQREVMERMQAAMAVVEGHAEHVMDALAPDLVPQHEGLRAAMDARRQSRSAPERILLRLLGMEMKMRQYKIGKEFCDSVVAAAGIEGLNRVWEGPLALPSLAELEHPEEWLGRVQSPQPKG